MSAIRRLAVAMIMVSAVLIAAPSPLHADLIDWRNWRHWLVDLDMSARYAGNAEDWQDETRAQLHQGAGRVDLRGFAGKSVLGVAAGIDLELGFEVPGGFVYGFHLLPLGLGLRLGPRAAIGVMGGVGVGGVVDRLPFAWELPVQAWLEFDVGRYVRFLGTARAIWTPGTDARVSGALDADFADEAEVGAGLAFGARHSEYMASWSDGTYVGVMVREQGGGRIFGLVLSLNMNGGDRRAPRRGPE